MSEIFLRRDLLIVLLTIFLLLPAYMCSYNIDADINSPGGLNNSISEGNSTRDQFNPEENNSSDVEFNSHGSESTTDKRSFFNELLQKHVYTPDFDEMQNPFMGYSRHSDNLSQVASAFMGFSCISKEAADFIVNSLSHDYPDLWLPPTDVLSLSELKTKILLTLDSVKGLKLEFESTKSVFESVYTSFSEDLITKNLKRYSQAMETLKMYRILEAKNMYKLKHIWKPECKAKEKMDLFEHFNPSANMKARKKYILKNRNIFQHSIRSLYVAKLLGVVACDAMKFNFKSMVRLNLSMKTLKQESSLDDLTNMSESFTSLNPFEFNYGNVKSHEDIFKQLLKNYVEIINTEDRNFRDEYFALEEGIQGDLRMHGTILSTTVTNKHIKYINRILSLLTKVIDSNAYILQRINEISNQGIKSLPKNNYPSENRIAAWAFGGSAAACVISMIFRDIIKSIIPTTYNVEGVINFVARPGIVNQIAEATKPPSIN
ncbi:hypothetical protein NEAUS03_1057 [Nematocida ausubeli]|nr:hypothetical protein NEAUS03_1057 [Nematocida ausubeli]